MRGSYQVGSRRGALQPSQRPLRSSSPQTQICGAAAAVSSSGHSAAHAPFAHAVVTKGHVHAILANCGILVDRPGLLDDLGDHPEQLILLCNRDHGQVLHNELRKHHTHTQVTPHAVSPRPRVCGCSQYWRSCQCRHWGRRVTPRRYRTLSH